MWQLFFTFQIWDCSIEYPSKCCIITLFNELILILICIVNLINNWLNFYFIQKKIIYYYISKESFYFRVHSQWKFRKALTSDIQKPSVMLEERVDIFAASLMSDWGKDSESFDRSGSLWPFLKNACAFLSSHKKCFNIQKYLTRSWRTSSNSRFTQD